MKYKYYALVAYVLDSRLRGNDAFTLSSGDITLNYNDGQNNRVISPFLS